MIDDRIFRILQYNVQKRSNVIHISLIHDQEIQNYDILVIQKQSRALDTSQTYNSGNSRFHLVSSDEFMIRACIYVNKNIDTII